MKKYQVVEDNGGGLYLVVFNTKGQVEYLHSGYEYETCGCLLDDIKALKNGANPAKDWEGNVENPQEVYDNLTSYKYGWTIVADNDGIYPEKMGRSAINAFVAILENENQAKNEGIPAIVEE